MAISRPSTSAPSPPSSVTTLPGLSETDVKNLKRCGIVTTQQLLVRTQTPTQVQELAIQLRCRPQSVAKWTILAQLSQLPSVGPQYCGLLLHAGLGSIEQLAQMQAGQLHSQLMRLQVALVHRNDLCPTVAEVRQWILQAIHFTRQQR